MSDLNDPQQPADDNLPQEGLRAGTAPELGDENIHHLVVSDEDAYENVERLHVSAVFDLSELDATDEMINIIAAGFGASLMRGISESDPDHTIISMLSDWKSEGDDAPRKVTIDLDAALAAVESGKKKRARESRRSKFFSRDFKPFSRALQSLGHVLSKIKWPVGKKRDDN